MANDITSLIHQILVRGLPVLRETALMPQVVNLQYSLDSKTKGSTVDIPISAAKTATDVVPSNTPKQASGTTTSSIPITLDKWKESDFDLTDKEATQIMNSKTYLPDQAQECIRALANAVNEDLLSLYTGVYGYVGTAGTTPFSNATDRTAAKDATLVVKKLNDQLAPASDRSALLDSTAVAEATVLPQFSHAEKAGDNNVIQTANLGKQYNINWFSENAIKTHTPGVATGTPLTNGAPTIGSKAIVTDGWTNDVTGILVLGDIISFAGDSQTYVVTATVNSGSTTGPATIAIEPGLKVAVGDGAAITVRSTHVVNLAFHKQAFALATAPFEKDITGGNQTAIARDPVTGLVMRLEVERQHRQTKWAFDILWGSKLVRPEFACRLAG